MFQIAFLAPAVIDPGGIHPFVQEFCVGHVCRVANHARTVFADVEACDGGDGGVACWTATRGTDVCDLVLCRGHCGAAVDAGVAAEACDAEAEILAQGGDVAGVEGFALAWGFGAHGVADAVCEGVLEWCGWVECWEVGG